MRRLATVWLVSVLALCLGCGPAAAPTAPKNLTEWFQQKMSNVNTEDGSIDTESVRDVGQDTIEYQTVKSGTRKTWRQKFRPAGTGNYERVGDPEDVTAKVPEKVKG